MKIYIYTLLISENLESLINVETCILGHVWGVLQLNTSFPDVNFFFIFSGSHNTAENALRLHS